ncbi:hypothetical protein RvY_15204 [Ramazzottius varieornatus]|uniref:Uncharacterized protein n=1 Tax=Ramazzottius varieornatus TaxID=947166 RepID=A0A1D1VXJ6_RAMVA|nr:hypothetical protein RvY_15204 [Ramazzottius varieornatus]
MEFRKSRGTSITTATGSVLSLGQSATKKLLSLVEESPAQRRKRMGVDNSA